MKKQLQYTTAFVVLLVGVLLGTLYLLNTSPAFDGQSNALTAAGVGVDAIVDDAAQAAEIDCETQPGAEASQQEHTAWNQACESA